VVALAWLCKPLEDVVEQLYVPSNFKYLHPFDFCFNKYRWSRFCQPHRFCNPNTLSSSICSSDLLVSCVSTYVFCLLSEYLQSHLLAINGLHFFLLSYVFSILFASCTCMLCVYIQQRCMCSLFLFM
jgi:hypothetical protein